MEKQTGNEVQNSTQREKQREYHTEWQRRNRDKTKKYQKRWLLNKQKNELLGTFGLEIIYKPQNEIPSKGAIISIDGKTAIFIAEELKGTDEELTVIKHELGHFLSGTLHKLGTDAETVAEHERLAEQYAKGL